ncbi:MAG: carbamoyl-phosphate synthase large subunit [Firmicutes bacterium]|nr:carbamoyl-phosphate synthase large subunit [Bacillota bacterium]
MPLRKNLKKVLVIGSGPIVIGQAAEFDYAGTQACRVLRDNGIEIILVNSNPATIMTDTNIADRIYIEPLTLTTVKRIIEKERPDGILSGLGGQTGLTLSMQLAKSGYLKKYNVQLLGSSPDTIDKAEDRQLFKDTMVSIGQPVCPSVTTTDINEALGFADKIGYPVVVRPAFTMGGAGGGIAKDKKELEAIGSNGIYLSPINQILVEKSIAGWKEIEFEVMRDAKGNCLIICPMENVDPVGVHTGDSIVVAPTQTLKKQELDMLKKASIDIVNALGVEGGCNCQLALHPTSMEYATIEVNPRVSRSSALASKATGYPIAKVATMIAIGYSLDEIPNAITGGNLARVEPQVDYTVVKLPKWPFDKFVHTDKTLGTQMKATGEVMAIADTFEDALLKAIRGAELGLDSLNLPRLANKTDKRIRELLHEVTDQRIFVLYEAIKRGISIDEIYDITKVNPWFLERLKNIVERKNPKKRPSLVYKPVAPYVGKKGSITPYFYSVVGDKDCEALPYINKSKKKRVVVLGSGPIRIGQGVEFDYACVHCIWTLKKLGYETIVINNNPETVSTDFDTADRLYFEPINIDDVMNVINIEKPVGVVVAFGGGTAIKLAKELNKRGVNIIGTSADSIDICEDRKRFDELLEKLEISRPKGFGVHTEKEALKAAKDLGYPVLLRPSYVLGGQNMIIAYDQSDISEYMKIILGHELNGPILIDKYLKGREIEVDAICDGDDVFIPGVMEQIESTGVHSGDSICAYPSINIGGYLMNTIYALTQKITKALKVRGLINIQYVLYDNEIYVIEVNPRASRTVPYMSKVTNIPMCELATKTALGFKLKDLGVAPGIAKEPPYISVKVPVFSFEKLTGLDTHLGPEMKSTGEVMGIGRNLKEALFKGLVAAKNKLSESGGVFISVKQSDRESIEHVAWKFSKAGFTLFGTKGTADYLCDKGLKVTIVDKISQNPKSNILSLMDENKIAYIVSTSKKGRDPERDSVRMRRRACALGISVTTSVETAAALIDSIISGYSEENTTLVEMCSLGSFI